MSADETELIDLLGNAARILVFTGAGISTASGIPDYRGPQGVWNTRQPVTWQEFMGSGAARERYWQQKSEDWAAFSSAGPNVVHHALRELELAGRLHMLVTQNVDGLHSMAGTSPEKLVEIHGTNARVECQTCHWEDAAAPFYENFAREPEPPRCRCGGWLKPATISFGQSLRDRDLYRAFGAARECDLALALGSTLSVTPAAHIPLAAAQRGVPYIVVNRGSTDHDSRPDLRLRLEGDVSKIIPGAIAAALHRD